MKHLILFIYFFLNIYLISVAQIRPFISKNITGSFWLTSEPEIENYLLNKQDVFVDYIKNNDIKEIRVFTIDKDICNHLFVTDTLKIHKNNYSYEKKIFFSKNGYLIKMVYSDDIIYFKWFNNRLKKVLMNNKYYIIKYKKNMTKIETKKKKGFNKTNEISYIYKYNKQKDLIKIESFYKSKTDTKFGYDNFYKNDTIVWQIVYIYNKTGAVLEKNIYLENNLQKRIIFYKDSTITINNTLRKNKVVDFYDKSKQLVRTRDDFTNELGEKISEYLYYDSKGTIISKYYLYKKNKQFISIKKFDENGLLLYEIYPNSGIFGKGQYYEYIYYE